MRRPTAGVLLTAPRLAHAGVVGLIAADESATLGRAISGLSAVIVGLAGESSQTIISFGQCSCASRSVGKFTTGAFGAAPVEKASSTTLAIDRIAIERRASRTVLIPLRP